MVCPRDGGEPFILLYTPNDDRVARNLSDKDLGVVVRNGWRYSWRKRDGYTNNLYLTAKGLAARDDFTGSHNT